jgi:hypothetical protein
MTTDTVRPIVTDKRTEPCRHCPWLLSNQSKRHPDGWYTRVNLRRLWAKMRRGEDMSCHPTDPTNPVSDRAKAAGYRQAPPGTEVMECIGSHIVRQREFLILTSDFGANVKAYRAARPKGLTRQGISALAARAIFGGIPLVGGRPLPKPDLNCTDVGHPDLGEWVPRSS